MNRKCKIQASKKTIVTLTKPDEIGSGKSKMAASKLAILIPHIVRKITTHF